MTHLELASLMTDYVEGTLDAALAGQVNAHIEVCLECRAMVEDVRFAMVACSDATDLEPAPWLLSRIVRATIGERKPGVRERLLAWIRPAIRLQVAYSLSMVVFSLSFILYAANVNLRSMTLRDLNPATWVYRANSRGHMLMARAEKYYYDIRFVYEVQSILQNLRQQPSPQPGTPKNLKAPGSASTGEFPEAPRELAMEGGTAAGVAPARHLSRGFLSWAGKNPRRANHAVAALFETGIYGSSLY